jgi:DNA-binding transcriptional regulator YbjK
VADAAITALAQRGARGLTHRAVDEIAGLAPGSTSYYTRTREALLISIVERLAVLDLADAPGQSQLPKTAGELSAQLAPLIIALSTTHRDRTIARYELALEAARYPVLQEQLVAAGIAFRTAAVGLLAAIGSSRPDEHGRALVALCDGMVFESTVGAGSGKPFSKREIRARLTDLLRGMVGEKAG